MKLPQMMCAGGRGWRWRGCGGVSWTCSTGLVQIISTIDSAIPYSVNSTPYNLNPTPYTLHPTPYTLHPYTLPKPNAVRPAQGLAMAGVWGCLVDLQRVHTEVLSVAAQQLGCDPSTRQLNHLKPAAKPPTRQLNHLAPGVAGA